MATNLSDLASGVVVDKTKKVIRICKQKPSVNQTAPPAIGAEFRQVDDSDLLHAGIAKQPGSIASRCDGKVVDRRRASRSSGTSSSSSSSSRSSSSDSSQDEMPANRTMPIQYPAQFLGAQLQSQLMNQWRQAQLQPYPNQAQLLPYPNEAPSVQQPIYFDHDQTANRIEEGYYPDNRINGQRINELRDQDVNFQHDDRNVDACQLHDSGRPIKSSQFPSNVHINPAFLKAASRKRRTLLVENDDEPPRVERSVSRPQKCLAHTEALKRRQALPSLLDSLCEQEQQVLIQKREAQQALIQKKREAQQVLRQKREAVMQKRQAIIQKRQAVIQKRKRSRNERAQQALVVSAQKRLRCLLSGDEEQTLSNRPQKRTGSPQTTSEEQTPQSSSQKRFKGPQTDNKQQSLQKSKPEHRFGFASLPQTSIAVVEEQRQVTENKSASAEDANAMIVKMSDTGIGSLRASNEEQAPQNIPQEGIRYSYSTSEENESTSTEDANAAIVTAEAPRVRKSRLGLPAPSDELPQREPALKIVIDPETSSRVAAAQLYAKLNYLKKQQAGYVKDMEFPQNAQQSEDAGSRSSSAGGIMQPAMTSSISINQLRDIVSTASRTSPVNLPAPTSVPNTAPVSSGIPTSSQSRVVFMDRPLGAEAPPLRPVASPPPITALLQPHSGGKRRTLRDFYAAKMAPALNYTVLPKVNVLHQLATAAHQIVDVSVPPPTVQSVPSISATSSAVETPALPSEAPPCPPPSDVPTSEPTHLPPSSLGALLQTKKVKRERTLLTDDMELEEPDSASPPTNSTIQNYNRANEVCLECPICDEVGHLAKDCPIRGVMMAIDDADAFERRRQRSRSRSPARDFRHGRIEDRRHLSRRRSASEEKSRRDTASRRAPDVRKWQRLLPDAHEIRRLRRLARERRREVEATRSSHMERHSDTEEADLESELLSRLEEHKGDLDVEDGRISDEDEEVLEEDDYRSISPPPPSPPLRHPPMPVRRASKLAVLECPMCYEVGHLEKDCPIRDAMLTIDERVRQSPVICSLCRKIGHSNRNCPLNEPPPVISPRDEDRKKICHKCGQIGHIQMYCTNTAMANRGGYDDDGKRAPPFCFNCNTVGHVARFCSFRLPQPCEYDYNDVDVEPSYVPPKTRADDAGDFGAELRRAKKMIEEAKKKKEVEES